MSKKLLWVMLAVLGIGWIGAAPVRGDALPSERELSQRLERAEGTLREKSNLPDRLQELVSLKHDLGEMAYRMGPKNRGEDDHRLRLSLISLNEALKRIEDHKFALERCPQFRSSILAEFKGGVSNEARQALKVLALVCGKPELGNVP